MGKVVKIELVDFSDCRVRTGSFKALMEGIDDSRDITDEPHPDGGTYKDHYCKERTVLWLGKDTEEES